MVATQVTLYRVLYVKYYHLSCRWPDAENREPKLSCRTGLHLHICELQPTMEILASSECRMPNPLPKSEGTELVWYLPNCSECSLFTSHCSISVILDRSEEIVPFSVLYFCGPSVRCVQFAVLISSDHFGLCLHFYTNPENNRWIETKKSELIG